MASSGKIVKLERMAKTKKITLLFLAVFFSAALLSGGFLKISAYEPGDAYRFIWGGSENPSDGILNGNENLGWISLARYNCDADADGWTEDGNGSAGQTPANSFFPNCPDNLPITTDVKYAVNIPSGDGNVTGYAWSANAGWIDFDPVGSYPAGPGHSVRRQGNNLIGWARVLSVAENYDAGRSGGWKGWIKMNGPGYEVTIDPFTGRLNGYAWNGESCDINGNGFIDFDCGGNDSTTACPPGGCVREGYGFISFNPAMGGGGKVITSPTVSLGGPPTPVLPNANFPSTPNRISIDWRIEGDASSCTASCSTPGGCGNWNWTRGYDQLNVGSNNTQTNVELKEVSVTYTLECNWFGSPPHGAGSITVYVGCQSRTCNYTTVDKADRCETKTILSTNPNSCIDECNPALADPCPRPDVNWREVAP